VDSYLVFSFPGVFIVFSMLSSHEDSYILPPFGLVHVGRQGKDKNPRRKDAAAAAKRVPESLPLEVEEESKRSRLRPISSSSLPKASPSQGLRLSGATRAAAAAIFPFLNTSSLYHTKE
jgi:hypothetical protein